MKICPRTAKDKSNAGHTKSFSLLSAADLIQTSFVDFQSVDRSLFFQIILLNKCCLLGGFSAVYGVVRKGRILVEISQANISCFLRRL